MFFALTLLRPLAIFATAAAFCALLTALALPRLRKYAGLQHVREDVPETHREKEGTPSMGGIPMLIGIAVSGCMAYLIMGRDGNRLQGVLAVVGLALSFAAIGLVDDIRKLGDRKSKGLLARYRIGLEVVIALFFCVLVSHPQIGTHPALGLGTATWPQWAAIAFGVFVIVGGSNAVNLTDGLDGLATGLTVVAGLALALCCGLGGADAGLLGLITAGGAAGFLIFNRKPAKVWMGDVGSLGLGALLAGTAVLGRIELLYGLIGLVFVAEALSVIIQVISFKTTGKRVFRMAPLHHHYELAGLKETQVVMRFWLAGIVVAIAAVAIVWGSHL